MDLVASCKDKLAYFRIKELKDVLTQLGLSKQGKKQDLVDRIINILSEESAPKIWPKKNSVGKEEVAKLVDDIYRKMQVSGATDLASMGQGVSNPKVKGEIDDPFRRDIKVRCPCTNALETESMIKCEDPRCHVWQHIGCVIIPEKPMEGSPPLPELFYCELCRLSRADPFWVTMVNNLYPVKLTTTDIPTDGTSSSSNPVQRVERTFHVSRADKEMVSKQDYDIQAWCMLLNDKVPFRMHWPLCADLQVNGIPVRAINRPGTQLLGANGRDDGPIITPCVKDGPNKIALTGIDARIFCLGVRLVKRRSVQQILGLIPKESDGESFEDALARVCRCVGGGPGTDNADSDSDLEVVAESISVNLRCPMSGSRIKVAGRFKPCVHMGGFDLDVFVELNQRSRKWQCPICLKNYSLENVIIDPYFNRITSKMRHCGEDIAEIELKPDGSWRVKTRTEAEHREVGELALWHTPAGSFSTPNGVEVDSKAEVAKQIKQEGMSGHTSNGLKIGIRKNRNGFWEVSSKPEEMNTSSSGNRLLENFESHEHKIIPMSSSATGSGRDDEDPSVNQDAGVNFDFTNNGVELDDSLALNGDHSYGFVEPNFPAPQGDAEVIVLSDSDDDILVYNDNQTDNGGATFSMPQPGIADPYPEDPTLGNDGTSSFGLFNPNDDEFGMSSLWHLPPETQAPPGFQLFSSDVSDALVDISHGPINCSTSINGYTLGSDMGPSGLIPDTSVGRSDTEMNDGLVNNPLAFGGEDPSLQIFLPTRPSNASVQSDVRDQTDVSNGVHTEDWISLRLGGGTTGSHGDSVAPNGINSRQHIPPREAAMDSLADTASLLLGMNDGRSDKASRKRSDSPFSFPRQKRSVRPPRLYLSIDSDSE